MRKTAKRKTYHHGDLRRAVLDAAVAVIAERGPHGFNVRELARRAGVSSGAPYRHFADRDAVLAALAQEGAERLGAVTEEEMARAGRDPLEQFRAMGIAYVKFAVAHPSHFRVMTMPEFDVPGEVDGVLAGFGLFASGGADTAGVANGGADTADGGADAADEAGLGAGFAGGAAVERIIDASQRAGSLYAADPAVIALAARCLVYGLARMFVDGQLPRAGIGPEQAEAIAIAVTGVLGHGLIPRTHEPDADC